MNGIISGLRTKFQYFKLPRSSPSFPRHDASPADVISSGTPEGFVMRHPPQFLQPGDLLDPSRGIG